MEITRPTVIRLMYLRNSPGLWGLSGVVRESFVRCSGSFGRRSGIVPESFGVVRVSFRGRSGVVREVRSEVVRQSFVDRSQFFGKI